MIHFLFDTFHKRLIITNMPFPKFTIRGFKAPREAMLASLGTLERKTLKEVGAAKKPMSAKSLPRSATTLPIRRL